ncbi:MAG: glycoside hydrolase family 9 protein [Rhizobiaceae bacterium]|nr:glycoside hydrolase family 9 protein [Rhizobiaceae bacterium]
MSSAFSVNQNVEGAQVVFQFGGAPAGDVFCLSEVSLTDGEVERGSTSSSDIALYVNQLGYLPNGPKVATLVHPSLEPVRWSLKTSAGELLANGNTQPFGFDPSSGFDAHQIIFSKFPNSVSNVYLEADGVRSDVFSIKPDLYDNLPVDALSYFYLVRSGIDISREIAGREFGRPAGHAADRATPCLDKSTASKIYNQSWTCSGKLDVSGGWYDAGDFGKYVVNGGIAVAQVLSSYERALYYSGSKSKLINAKLRNDNASGNLPDVLAEAKWQLDFLMRMQVPEGQEYAGMAHHKIHGVEWNGLPLWPHKDPILRSIHRPSTAATLNLAAVTAQAARLFNPYDADYARQLISVSKKAHAAALNTPDLFAPSSGGQYGGGDYDDDDVSDEFYWADVELFISTGDASFLNRIKASKYWSTGVFKPSGIDWRFLAGLARLQLALIPNALPDEDRLFVQRSVLAAADNYIAMQDNEAFGIMFKADEGLGWGSNSSVLQNMVVVASAYDLVKDKRYLNAVRKGMDYILGRNIMGISYVTGYGTRSSQNQHARIFAKNIDPSFPPMPKGALAGGPNSIPADEIAIKELEGCAPQACYIDHHKSFSTNEIAINWNAALSWVSAFLADTSAD